MNSRGRGTRGAFNRSKVQSGLVPAASTVLEKKVSRAEYSLAGSRPCKSALLFFSSPAIVPRHSTATVLSSSPHMLPAPRCLVL